MYLPDSCVLLTRFLSAEGVGEVLDFMPIEDAPPAQDPSDRACRPCRPRSVRFRWSAVPLSIMPAARIRCAGGRGAVFTAGDMRFALISRFPLASDAQAVQLELR